MPLTEHQEKRLVDWCMAHNVQATCPMCGRNDWSTGEVIAPRVATAPADEEAASSAEMIQIICDHCRLVMLFDRSTIADPR